MKVINDQPIYRRRWFVIVASIAAVLVVAWLLFVRPINNMTNAEEDVKKQLSNIQTSLQRRGDMIPQLAEAVKGSQGQESRVYGQIADARRQYDNSKGQLQGNASLDEKVAALQTQQKALNVMVNAVHENYPNLGSNDQMQRFMVEVEGSENRIAMDRREYNNKVTEYNKMVKSFPNSLLAGATGHHSLQGFTADDKSQTAPNVSFSQK